MKVYSGILPEGLVSYYKGVKKVKTIIAAKSMTEAADLMGYSQASIKNFFDISSDILEIKMAKQHPGIVLQSSSLTDNNFKPVVRNISNQFDEAQQLTAQKAS